MNKAEFDHAIRAAGSILGESDLLVIGSQAAHGSISGELPPEALRSVEVDVAAFDDPDGATSDLVDGAGAMLRGPIAACNRRIALGRDRFRRRREGLSPSPDRSSSRCSTSQRRDQASDQRS